MIMPFNHAASRKCLWATGTLSGRKIELWCHQFNRPPAPQLPNHGPSFIRAHDWAPFTSLWLTWTGHCAFYQNVMGFQVQAQEPAYADLGAGRETLVTLTELAGARQVRNHTGLYHFAILTPSRLALAQSLLRLVETRTPIGGSDHLVSEAIYLSDPDGNGIEIYRDRPRSVDLCTWRNPNGDGPA